MFLGLSPDLRVKRGALVPQAALVADLHGRAAKEHRTKAGIANMAHRLKQQPPGLTATRAPAIDHDVGRRREKRGLGTGLRRDRLTFDYLRSIAHLDASKSRPLSGSAKMAIAGADTGRSLPSLPVCSSC